MTTAGPATQTRKTVTVQDVQLFSLGQRTDKAGPLAAVPGLGNVVATFCIIPGPISTHELTVTITGLALTTDTPAVVLLQPRQAANQDFGFPGVRNQLQLIGTANSGRTATIPPQFKDLGSGHYIRRFSCLT